MKNFTLSALLILFGSGFSEAQSSLCSPTFDFGCMNWNANYVVVGGMDWTFDGIDCTVSDYSIENTAIINAGDSTYMEVESGNWCGCSVWIDFNRDNQLDDSENLYYSGNGGTETNIFMFKIKVPSTTINGTYIMRVLTTWGSDGFTPGGVNGSGGCGAYQYGNFNDFSVLVENGVAGIDEAQTKISLQPNPASEFISFESPELREGSGFKVLDLRGIELKSGKISNSLTKVEIEDLKSGLYFIQFENKAKTHTFVKQ